MAVDHYKLSPVDFKINTEQGRIIIRFVPQGYAFEANPSLKPDRGNVIVRGFQLHGHQAVELLEGFFNPHGLGENGKSG